MKNLLQRPTAWALFSLLTPLIATAVHADGEVRIFTAIEVEFSTSAGQLYQLQGSSNLTEWADIGDPVFGNGLTVSRMFSTKGGGEVSFANYRLTTATNPVVGLAPWSFEGVSLSFGDDGLLEHLDFLTPTNGVKVSGTSSEPFSYGFVRTGDNEARAEVIRGTTAYYADRREVYTFSFSATDLGTYVREEFRGTSLKSRRLGTFRGLSGLLASVPSTGSGTNQPGTGTNGVVTVPIAPPANLAGLEYYFHRGETPEHFQFTTETNAFEIEGKVKLYYGQVISGERTPVAYGYALTSSNQALLSITYPKDRRDEYVLTFTQGAQGTYLRTEFKGDRVSDQDDGTFSPLATPPLVVLPPNSGGSGTNSVSAIGETNAPVSLLGETLTVKNDSDTHRLVFATASAGTEFSSGDADPFTYTYEKKSETAASAVVRFKSDKWDEYDLTFTPSGTGTVVWREFKNNQLDRTRSSTFTLVRTP